MTATSTARSTRRSSHALSALTTFVWLNLALAISVLVGHVVVGAFFVRKPGVWLNTAVISLDVAALALSLRALKRGGPRFAVAAIFVSNWMVCVAATAVAKVVFPITLLALLIPIMLAIPHLDSRALAVTIAATAGVALLMTLVVITGSRDGLVGEMPRWLPDSVRLIFVPGVLGLIAVIGWQSHAELRRRADDLLSAQHRLVATADRSRRAIERDLHDGAQQRLVGVAMALGAVERLLERDADRAGVLLASTTLELQIAITELRDLAHGIYPPLLAERGLVQAVRAAARRVPIPVTVHGHELGRFRPDVESAVYFCCLEAIQNAAKHAGAGAEVTVSFTSGPPLRFEVRDTGHGFPSGRAQPGHGMTNMRDRLAIHGGELTVESTPGHGTVVYGVLNEAAHTVGGPRADRDVNNPQALRLRARPRRVR